MALIGEKDIRQLPLALIKLFNNEGYRNIKIHVNIGDIKQISENESVEAAKATVEFQATKMKLTEHHPPISNLKDSITLSLRNEPHYIWIQVPKNSSNKRWSFKIRKACIATPAYRSTYLTTVKAYIEVRLDELREPPKRTPKWT